VSYAQYAMETPRTYLSHILIGGSITEKVFPQKQSITSEDPTYWGQTWVGYHKNRMEKKKLSLGDWHRLKLILSPNLEGSVLHLDDEELAEADSQPRPSPWMF
jgi:hypothetical protein